METGEEQEIETAYHEAGHAFALLALGGELEFVTITPMPGKYDGLCQPVERAWPPYLHGIFCLAGFAAFQRLQPEPSEEELQRNRSADFAWAHLSAQTALLHCLETELPSIAANASARAQLFAEMQVPAPLLVALCTREANRLVEEGWEAIEAIALALLDHKTLSGAEAARLARTALPAFPFRPAPAQLTPAEAEQMRRLALTYYRLIHPTLLSGEAL